MHCLGCGYTLVRLRVGACPECGRAFDKHDPTTYGRRPEPVPELRVAFVSFLWSLFFYTVAALVGWLVSLEPAWPTAIVSAGVATEVIVAGVGSLLLLAIAIGPSGRSAVVLRAALLHATIGTMLGSAVYVFCR